MGSQARLKRGEWGRTGEELRKRTAKKAAGVGEHGEAETPGAPGSNSRGKWGNAGVYTPSGGSGRCPGWQALRARESPVVYTQTFNLNLPSHHHPFPNSPHFPNSRLPDIQIPEHPSHTSYLSSSASSSKVSRARRVVQANRAHCAQSSGMLAPPSLISFRDRR